MNETKFLGVIIDDQLNWQSHMKQIVTKLHKNYYIIKKASRLLSMASLTMLINYMILYICHICFTVVICTLHSFLFTCYGLAKELSLHYVRETFCCNGSS